MTQGSPTPGVVIWITGLSGSGKTTLAKALAQELRKEYPNTALVDGDTIREISGSDLGYDPVDRLKNAYRVSRICHYLSLQGIHTVCSTVSLFHEIHDWNRKHCPRYLEVYLKVSVDTLTQRDSKKIYSSATNQKNPHVVGVDQSFEIPKEADLEFENDFQQKSLDRFRSQIMELFEQKRRLA